MEQNHNQTDMHRRKFIKSFLSALGVMMIPGILSADEQQQRIAQWMLGENYKPADHYWGMGIDVNKCIGCGRCAASCKIENDVPEEPFFFRTWVERYQINDDGVAVVDSPNGAVDGFTSNEGKQQQTAVRTFFVPKICNHCDHPPCVQVCPVGATFITPDGVILVDAEHCIGCRYCIQSCPYGARFLDPRTKTAEKCTFCYHRIVKDMTPVCVEVCPTQARIFGENEKKASPLRRFMRMNKIGVLKPSLNTEPKVYYANLDMEVR